MSEQPMCCLCGNPCEPWHEPPTGYGNNPWPFGNEDDRCCNRCDASRVIPARIAQFIKHPDGGENT